MVVGESANCGTGEGAGTIASHKILAVERSNASTKDPTPRRRTQREVVIRKVLNVIARIHNVGTLRSVRPTKAAPHTMWLVEHRN